MIVLRYLFGSLWCLFVWLLVAGFVGFAVLLVFPTAGGESSMVGIGMDWRNLPGPLLGLVAARQSWCTHVKPVPQK